MGLRNDDWYFSHSNVIEIEDLYSVFVYETQPKRIHKMYTVSFHIMPRCCLRSTAVDIKWCIDLDYIFCGIHNAKPRREPVSMYLWILISLTDTITMEFRLEEDCRNRNGIPAAVSSHYNSITWFDHYFVVSLSELLLWFHSGNISAAGVSLAQNFSKDNIIMEPDFQWALQLVTT